MRLFNRYLALLLIAAVLFSYIGIPPNTAEAATIDIDEFTTNSFLISVEDPIDIGPNGNVALGAGIIGGERDINLTLLSSGGDGTATARVSLGAFKTSIDVGTTVFAQIQWDGIDGDYLNVNPTGLGSLDLTDGGASDGFLMCLNFADINIAADIEVFTDAGNSSVRSFILPPYV